VPYADGDLDPLPVIPDEEFLDENGSLHFEMPMTDLLIHAEVHLPQGEEMKAAKVKKQSRNEGGEIVCTYDDNPILNTLVYDVEFPYGEVREYAANLIKTCTLKRMHQDLLIRCLIQYWISVKMAMPLRKRTNMLLLSVGASASDTPQLVVNLTMYGKMELSCGSLFQ